MNIFQNIKAHLDGCQSRREEKKLERAGHLYSGYIIPSMTHFESIGTPAAILRSALDAGASEGNRLLVRTAEGTTVNWIISNGALRAPSTVSV